MHVMIKRIFIPVLVFILVLALVGCNKTSYEESENIIEAADLEGLLSDSTTVVVDARSAEDYAKGHLDGAINLTPAELSIAEPVNSMLAPKEQVEMVLGAKGISNESKIYIYDNNGGISASRVWWVLKVYGHDVVKVINGGQEAVVSAGLALSTDVPNSNSVEYIAQDANTSLIASLDEVISITEGLEDAILLDVRSQAEYDEGAIPSAILYSHSKNLYVDGTFKSARDTYLDYNDLGIDREDTIVVYCKSSFRAAQTMLVLNEAGYENIKLYDGAWLEWSTKDLPKEETKEEVKPSAGDGS